MEGVSKCREDELRRQRTYRIKTLHLQRAGTIERSEVLVPAKDDERGGEEVGLDDGDDDDGAKQAGHGKGNCRIGEFPAQPKLC